MKRERCTCCGIYVPPGDYEKEFNSVTGNWDLKCYMCLDDINEALWDADRRSSLRDIFTVDEFARLGGEAAILVM